MTTASAQPGPSFSQPVRQILLMLIVMGLVSAGAWLAYTTLAAVIGTGKYLNFAIMGVFVLGVVSCIWQVVQLVVSVSWIEGFVENRPGVDASNAPRLLAPLAALLAGRRLHISTSSRQSILDSVATRIDEARDITRYIVNLLILMGLLGTFYGLATTVPAVVETIRNLAPSEGETGVEVFEKLMTGLQAQLGGMGTAFSSSLLGLAGSLVVGLLELFAGHGQNRFYRELEEWLSTITRLGAAPSEGDGGGQGGEEAAVLAGALGDFAHRIEAQMEALMALSARAEAGRAVLDDRILRLAGSVERLAQRIEGDASAQAALAPVLERIAAAQEAQGQAAAEGLAEQAELLQRLVAAQEDEDGRAGVDAESRMRLRSIDVQLLRILEEISAGRQESMTDLRGDLAALTTAIRQLSRGGGLPGRGG